jgi:coenzyme PQQ precursor peptide PqqA
VRPAAENHALEFSIRTTDIGSSTGDIIMRKWTAPKVIEICLGMEINCYASAQF